MEERGEEEGGVKEERGGEEGECEFPAGASPPLFSPRLCIYIKGEETEVRRCPGQGRGHRTRGCTHDA